MLKNNQPNTVRLRLGSGHYKVHKAENGQYSGRKYLAQCARTDLNKRFLPKPMTTTG